MLRVIKRPKVRHSEPRVVHEHLASGDHVEGALAHAVRHGHHLVALSFGVEAHRDGAPAGADVDHARRAVGFLGQRSEGLNHKRKTDTVGLERR